MVKMTDTAPKMPEDFPSNNEMPSQISADSSDFSLVSHPPESNIIVNGSFSTVQDINFGLNSASVDLSFEEMQLSVQRLLQENAELKDVVQQDHETMKNQYELILSSKEQIETFMKQQLQRREQAKSLVDKLQAENEELKKELEGRGDASDKQKQIELLKTELEKLKLQCESETEESEQTILYHQLQLEMVELRADFNQMKGSHTHLLAEKRELAAMNAELQAKLSGLQQSPDEFIAASDGSGDGGDQQSFLLVEAKSSSVCENANKSLKIEEQTIKGLLAQLSLEQNKSQVLSMDLDAEKAKVGELSKQVQGQEEVIRRLVLGNQEKDAQDKSTDLIAELQASEHKINIANGYIQKYRDRCDALENELHVYEGKFETLQSREQCTVAKFTAEIQCLKKTLEAEQIQSAEDKKSLQELQFKLDLVMQDNQQLQHQLEDFSQEQLSKGRQSEAYYCIQMKTLQEKNDSLTANMVNCKEALEARSAELLATKEDLQRLQTEAETIPILQAQVEVYKADFRAEREARESAQAEKEHVLEELRATKIRLGEHPRRSGRRHARQSADEEAMDQSTVSAISSNTSAPQMHNFGSSMNTTPAAVVQEITSYICPKCGLKFDSYHPLLNHVNECLDRD